MSSPSLLLRPERPPLAVSGPGCRLERLRVGLGDGAATTLHVASFERATFVPRVTVLGEPQPLARWCAGGGIRHAVVGGFFIRATMTPLGQLRLAGREAHHEPFDAPWGGRRACLHVERDGAVQIARRDALDPGPGSELLQAGPLLVADGQPVVRDGEDPEGFSAGARQFDSDITAGRYPRAALGLSEDRLLAVACDGRTEHDAGLTLGELAEAMVHLGADSALNLDGGGSASLVYDGRLRNRPREQHGIDLLEGRAVVTAVVFAGR